jgi:hypothetical protein
MFERGASIFEQLFGVNRITVAEGMFTGTSLFESIERDSQFFNRLKIDMGDETF